MKEKIFYIGLAFIAIAIASLIGNVIAGITIYGFLGESSGPQWLFNWIYLTYIPIGLSIVCLIVAAFL